MSRVVVTVEGPVSRVLWVGVAVALGGADLLQTTRIGVPFLPTVGAAIAATAALESHLPKETAVVRVMPNTPALARRGMAALTPEPIAAGLSWKR